MPSWLSPIRLAIGIVAIAAIVLGVVAWVDDSDISEEQRRFICPDPADVPAADLPDEELPASEHRVSLTQIAEVEEPVALTTRADDPALYVGERPGRIVRLDEEGAEPVTVVDLRDEVLVGLEQGLLGVTFSPDGQFLYVHFNDKDGHTNVVEYRTTADGVDEASRRLVLFVRQPHRWHNGGHIAFGPDGMFYIGLGDGGGFGDPLENGQNPGTLLGTILRIDPRPSVDREYGIPSDNPFVGARTARPEVWDYGLRNPWRFSFDRATGDLWIADVGEGCFEEINREPAGRGGRNYGWDHLEGDWEVLPPAPPNAIAPVHAYRRTDPTCAVVVGGYVYRGERIPDLRGTYVFGDFCGAQLMGLDPDDPDTAFDLGPRVSAVVSFAQDQAGELYVMSLNGEIYRVDPPAGAGSADEPAT